MLKPYLFIASLFFSMNLMAADGVIKVQSQQDFEASQASFIKTLEERGFTLIQTVDHQANAAKVDMELQPSVVYIFGNPRVGTQLMNCQPSVAIDLPQKMHIFQDKADKVWFSYNDPQYLNQRHDLSACEPLVKKVQMALKQLTAAAWREKE